MRLFELFDESASFDYMPGANPANDIDLPSNHEEIALAMQEYVARSETMDEASNIIGEEFGIAPSMAVACWNAIYGEDLEEAKNATQVAVKDNGREYLYWVSQSRPEKAISAALKKHRLRFGYGMKAGGRFIDDKELHADIIGKLHPDETEPEVLQPMPPATPGMKYA